MAGAPCSALQLRVLRARKFAPFFCKHPTPHPPTAPLATSTAAPSHTPTTRRSTNEGESLLHWRVGSYCARCGAVGFPGYHGTLTTRVGDRPFVVVGESGAHSVASHDAGPSVWNTTFEHVWGCPALGKDPSHLACVVTLGEVSDWIEFCCLT